MRAFITGGAGFIGSSMAGRLLLGAHNTVTVFDNFSSGHHQFLPPDSAGGRLRVVRGDLLDFRAVLDAIPGHDIVFHFASNPDITRGMTDTSLDLNQSIVATYNLLESMRVCDVKHIVFPSGSGVYGDTAGLSTAEDFGPLLPISMYGAGKLGAEALISAYCHMFDMRCHILRLANVVGRNQTHGVALDFMRKLSLKPDRLTILGDGRQSKSYIHVEDVLDAIFFLDAMCDEQINLYNVATEDTVEVQWIADTVCGAMGLSGVLYEYTGGPRGWPGDVPVVHLNIDKILKLGWRPRMNSKEAVRLSVTQLLERLRNESWSEEGQ